VLKFEFERKLQGIFAVVHSGSEFMLDNETARTGLKVRANIKISKSDRRKILTKSDITASLTTRADMIVSDAGG